MWVFVQHVGDAYEHDNRHRWIIHKHSWSLCQGLIPSKYHLGPFILELDLRAQPCNFYGFDTWT